MAKTLILGKAVATAEQMAAHLLSENPAPKINMDPVAFCRLYLYIGALEGVRGDGLFAQSCWETNYYRYGGTVTPDQNNFAGLGTTSATVKGGYFPDEATGILAQAQHAKTYATKNDLVYDCVDPRRTAWFVSAKGGTAQCWEDLGGTWAVPGYDTKKYSSLKEANDARDSYGYKITNILNKILGVTETPTTTTTPLSGKKICLDAGHYGKYNRSPGVPEYYESEAMWKLHLLLKKHLELRGATVITTRSNQSTDLALNARGRAAQGCDLFLSLHTNAVGGGMNEVVDYVAVYHLTEDAKATCDDASEDAAKLLSPAIATVMGTSQPCKVLTRKSSEDRNGDGVLNDNYYSVLHGARMVDVPGMILEHSFHTNTRSTKWLLVDANLDKLAEIESEKIVEYFSGQKAPVKNGVPYYIRIANVPVNDVLYIRKEPNADAAVTGKLAYNDPNKYTIVAESNGWGKLKSGIGWVNLKYTVKAV